jgi:hypothetical protein
MLERCWGIGEAERHDEAFEVTVAGAEGCLPLVAGLDAEEIIGAAEVDLGEDFGASEAVEGFRNEGEGVAIFYSDAIEAPVVDAEAEGAVLFLDE